MIGAITQVAEAAVADQTVLELLQSIEKATHSMDEKLTILLAVLVAAALAYFACRWLYG